MEVSLDSYVKVKLTDVGHDIIEHSPIIHNLKIDESGYYILKLSALLDVFGKHQYTDITTPFENNIIILS